MSFVGMAYRTRGFTATVKKGCKEKASRSPLGSTPQTAKAERRKAS